MVIISDSVTNGSYSTLFFFLQCGTFTISLYANLVSQSIKSWRVAENKVNNITFKYQNITWWDGMGTKLHIYQIAHLFSISTILPKTVYCSIISDINPIIYEAIWWKLQCCGTCTYSAFWTPSSMSSEKKISQHQKYWIFALNRRDISVGSCNLGYFIPYLSMCHFALVDNAIPIPFLFFQRLRFRKHVKDLGCVRCKAHSPSSLQ